MDLTGLGSVATLLNGVIDRIFPDKQAADAAKLEVLKLQQSGELAVLAAYQQQDKNQADINVAEAQNPHLFVSGGRPAVIWVCALVLLYSYLVSPLLSWILLMRWPEIHPPVLPMEHIGDLILGLLGLGGMRTFEKFKGVASK